VLLNSQTLFPHNIVPKKGQLSKNPQNLSETSKTSAQEISENFSTYLDKLSSRHLQIVSAGNKSKHRKEQRSKQQGSEVFLPASETIYDNFHAHSSFLGVTQKNKEAHIESPDLSLIKFLQTANLERVIQTSKHPPPSKPTLKEALLNFQLPNEQPSIPIAIQSDLKTKDISPDRMFKTASIQSDLKTKDISPDRMFKTASIQSDLKTKDISSDRMFKIFNLLQTSTQRGGVKQTYIRFLDISSPGKKSIMVSNNPVVCRSKGREESVLPKFSKTASLSSEEILPIFEQKVPNRHSFEARDHPGNFSRGEVASIEHHSLRIDSSLKDLWTHMIKKIDIHYQKGENQVQLKIHDQQLGFIDIQISFENRQISLNLQAHREDTQSLLAENIHELHELFHRSYYKVGDIEMGKQFEQNSMSKQEGQGFSFDFSKHHQSDQRKNKSFPVFTPSPGEEAPISPKNLEVPYRRQKKNDQLLANLDHQLYLRV